MATQSTFLTDVSIAEDTLNISDIVSGTNQTSQSTLLLKKRKEMREVDDALNFMKEEFKTRSEACVERQRDFERKQSAMNNQVLKFEKFIQENDAKTKRADKKVQSEKKAREAADEKIRKLKAQYEQYYTNEKVFLEVKLQKLRRYGEYLDIVLREGGEQYTEVIDILNRHRTLTDAHSDLEIEVDKDQHDVDEMRGVLNHLHSETQNKILTMNSEIHKLQKKIESTRTYAFKLNIDRETSDSHTKEKSKEYGQILMAIKNLNNRCFTSLNRKPRPVDEGDFNSPVDNLMEHLNDIRDRVVDLIDISDGYKDYATKGKEAAMLISNLKSQNRKESSEQFKNSGSRSTMSKSNSTTLRESSTSEWGNSAAKYKI